MRIYLRINKGKLSEENEKKGKTRKNSLFLDYHTGRHFKQVYEQ